ncbi:Transforming protein Ski, partial [Trinorchestia longiramus]
KGEALLEGQKVSCFIVGGERRLCFPQVLYTSLKDFSMAQINAEIESLHIYLSLCSSRQLQMLKDACALPSTAKSCGLITYSDAHRLTHALVHQFISNAKTSQLTSVNSHSTNQLIPNIIVSHRCFGKCRGWVYLSLYVHPGAKCIQCCECRSFYSPEQFVCHAHRSLETRTCHWGFDPANWRMYLQLASDQPRQPTSVVLPETFLEQFKTKF